MAEPRQNDQDQQNNELPFDNIPDDWNPLTVGNPPAFRDTVASYEYQTGKNGFFLVKGIGNLIFLATQMNDRHRVNKNGEFENSGAFVDKQNAVHSMEDLRSNFRVLITETLEQFRIFLGVTSLDDFDVDRNSVENIGQRNALVYTGAFVEAMEDATLEAFRKTQALTVCEGTDTLVAHQQFREVLQDLRVEFDQHRGAWYYETRGVN